MHISEVEKMRLIKEEKMRNGQDYKAETQADRMRKGFAEHDGNYDNNVLGMRFKVPNSGESMPIFNPEQDAPKQDKSQNT